MRPLERLLVTGGAGFIGSAFIRHLFSNPGFSGHVTNLDLLTYAGNLDNLIGSVDESRYTFAHGDICDRALVLRLCREHAIDTIVHFAAESHVDRSILGPSEFVRTNIGGTFELLEAAREIKTLHFHHVSTDEVYGSLGPSGAFDEESPYRPSSPYSASKAASDHLVRAYVHTYGLSATISNCSNNYGPCQFPEKLIPLMISNLFEGKPLPVYGDGKNVRDWLFVDDHAAAIWLILKNGRSGSTYNVGGNSERTNLELIHELIGIVAETTERDPATLARLITFIKDRPGHDRRYAIDCSKLESELGFEPKHALSAGLRETVRWYQTHGDWLERVRSGAYREWLKENYELRDGAL